MLPVLPSSCLAAVPLKPLPKPGRADTDERWDAQKTKSAPSASSTRKNATSAPKPGRSDSAERWDAQKKAASPASSSSSSGTSSLASSSKSPVSRVTSAEGWDVHKKRRLPQAELLDDGESSSTASNDIDMDTEEEIVWKPRAMYAGPGFAAVAPQPGIIPMPAFLVPVA